MASEERKRPVRVAERIREELEGLLLRGAVHDPGVAGATVSGVSVSPDLSVADVRVRIYNREVDEPQRKRVVRAFERAKGLLRRELAARLSMRHTPELRFHWDSGVDHALRIETLLEEIRQEDPEALPPRAQPPAKRNKAPK
jgi:ribosome-binding factor A